MMNLMNIWEELEKMEPELARLFSPRDDSPRLQTCGVVGCKNKVLGSRYCARCEEEINALEDIHSAMSSAPDASQAVRNEI